MATQSITEHFDEKLGAFLADKIVKVYPKFNKREFVGHIKKNKIDKSYTERVELIADSLHTFLGVDYTKAVGILRKILGPENANETGMFTHFYWILPIAKFVEKYGLADFILSMEAIADITKRNTGEYAVRPFIRKYPAQSLRIMKRWAKSDNFHLRRLASEGLRPKLPWASKLDTFIEHPAPVFEILTLLKEDNRMFVKKSVANHLRDYLKVNRREAEKLIKEWSRSSNANTTWILKHAKRKGL